MLCVREVADDSERKLFQQRFPRLYRSPPWRVLYSLIVGVKWCLAPYLRKISAFVKHSLLCHVFVITLVLGSLSWSFPRLRSLHPS